MAIKTISLELDAYEKLKRAKREGESFSQVVRRARFDAVSGTGEAILAELVKAHRDGRALPDAVEAYWEQAVAEDAATPRVSDSHWTP